MSGIAGVLHTQGIPATHGEIQRMTTSLTHRGPDGEGVVLHQNCALGHRRLATMDMSATGHQPMLSPDGNLVLTYDGILYNYKELRQELKTLGFIPTSSGDSAVLLLSWLVWGPECVRKLNGHFAFALLNKQKHSLFLARDRYGTHPLYWSHTNNTFLFASEIKGLLAHPHCTKSLDTEALPEYFTFQNFFTERTLFKNIFLFPRASVGRIDLQQGTLHTEPFWDYHFCEEHGPMKAQEYVEELDHLVQQAVRRQLVADVEIGAYLSGGIDSGIISALAAKQQQYIKSFTCGFDISSASGVEMGFDERFRAEAMSAAFKTEHYEMVLKSGDMERIMPSVMRHIEEPRVGQSYPNYYIAQLASKFVKIVLSGAGGDELFAGYPWRYYRVCDAKNFATFADGYYNSWQRLIPGNTLAQFLRPIAKQVAHVDTRAIFQQVFAPCVQRVSCPEDAINLSLYFEATTFMQGLLLVDDKLSMAHGLETRTPFLDNDLVDFAMRCPVHHKLHNVRESMAHNENELGSKLENYWRRTHEGKQILRKAAQKYIPDSVINADKQGFSAPDASWFKGDSLNFVKKRLFQKKRPMYQVIDYATTEKLVCEHLEGKQNRRLLIWSLLCFDYWFDIFHMD